MTSPSHQKKCSGDFSNFVVCRVTYTLNISLQVCVPCRMWNSGVLQELSYENTDILVGAAPPQISADRAVDCASPVLVFLSTQCQWPCGIAKCNCASGKHFWKSTTNSFKRCLTSSDPGGGVSWQNALGMSEAGSVSGTTHIQKRYLRWNGIFHFPSNFRSIRC